MTPDELNRIDLNLLVSFNALMDERSVSRAADRLHVTQPAMSKTLQRLRVLFNDPLFICTPKGLEPTPHGLRLQQPVAKALDQLIMLMIPAHFDPAELDRTFSLAMPDPIAALLIPGLVRRLYQEAPGVSLKLLAYSGDSIRALAKGTLDFVVGVQMKNTPASIHARILFQDQPFCVMRSGHPLANKAQLTIEEVVGYDHIKTWFKGINDRGPLDIQLEAVGLCRHNRIEASHFITIIRTLQSSDTLTLTIGFGSWFKVFPGEELRWVAVPELFKLFTDYLNVHIFWDERSHNDPAYRWFRQLIVNVVGEELEGAPGTDAFHPQRIPRENTTHSSGTNTE